MSDDQDAIPDHWVPVGKTGSITRRFAFENYAATNVFLDGVNAMSEETGLFPDLGFASTYANVTIPADDADGGTARRNRFALNANRLYDGEKS